MTDPSKRDKIIDFLKKKPDYVSGDMLAQRLGISRQALWKHIQELKDSGYEITAVPHLGYRLSSSPDRLYESELSKDLNTKFIGRRIYYFDTVSSTMEVAMQLGLKMAPSGTLVVAESQTKGKGRLGRNWFSPKYKGIYASLIIRPRLLPSQAPILTLLCAVSICEAIKEVVSVDVSIKWPNDLLLGNKKIGGILTELNAEMDEINFLVIGIGLNVNNDKKSLLTQAGSLKEKKQEHICRVALLQEILRRIEANYLLLEKRGSAAILDKWKEHNITLGRRVKVYCLKEHIEGEAVDVDCDGGLLVRKDSGLTEKVVSGDIIHCR